MKLKLHLALVSFYLVTASLYATNLQTFNLTWSGGTPFILAHFTGNPQINTSAFATAQLTLDFDSPNLAPLLTGQGVYVLPISAFNSLTMTVTGASSGNGSFTLNDFQNVQFNTLGTALDFSQDLIGQTLDDGAAFGVYPGNVYPASPDAGNFQLSSGTSSTGAPTVDSTKFIMTTNSGAGNFLQLTSFTIVPEASNVITGETVAFLFLGALWLSRKRRQAAR